MKTKKGEEDFHQSRRMFCIKDGKIRVAPVGVTWSHVEWFKHEGWFEEDPSDFLKKNIRGCYSPIDNTLYCYTGVGFSFNEETIESIKSNLAEIWFFLGLFHDTKISFGPKDHFIDGKEWEQKTIGKLEKFQTK